MPQEKETKGPRTLYTKVEYALWAETFFSATLLMSMRSNFASNSPGHSAENFRVALILQALQISFVLTPTRGAEARWGLPRAPNPPEGRFFTPPVALFRRLPAHPPLSAPPLCVTVGVFHRHRHQPSKSFERKLVAKFCARGVRKGGVMRVRIKLGAQ